MSIFGLILLYKFPPSFVSKIWNTEYTEDLIVKLDDLNPFKVEFLYVYLVI